MNSTSLIKQSSLVLHFFNTLKQPLSLSLSLISILHIPAVNILGGAIKGDEVTLTFLPAAVAGGIKEYVVFYKPRNVKRVWEFKRTKQPQITLRSLQPLTYYTVMVIGYTSNGDTYGSQDLHFKTSNGM